jgi:type I restriction enzyme S subunit
VSAKTLKPVLTLAEDSLPTSWKLASIPDLIGDDGVFVDGDWVESKDQDPNGDVRLIQLADIGDGVYRNKSARFLTKAKSKELRCHFLAKGDVLIARMPDPLGRACIFPGDSKESVTVVDVAFVRAGNDGFSHKWLMYFVNAPAFRAAVASLQSGTTRKRISRKNLSRIQLPVPPRDQQDRIVAEIEKQFSRLDEAVASLKRVKANLKRYKAAVLKAAVEGKLTEEWRKQNPDVEPASKLLARILAERRTKWEEAELAKMKVKGKEPKNDKWKEKYKEPTASGAEGDGRLPTGWVVVTVEQLAAIGTGATPLKSNKAYYDNGDIPWVTSGALNDDSIKESEHFVTQLALEETNVKRFPANSLLIAMYGEGKTRGKVSELLIEATTNQACAALIFDGLAKQLKDYVKLFFRKNYDDIRRLSSGGVQPNLNVGMIKRTLLPVPPIEEQLVIFDLVEQQLSVLSEMDSQLSSDIAKAGRLRQSALAKAFSGQLVFPAGLSIGQEVA